MGCGCQSSGPSYAAQAGTKYRWVPPEEAKTPPVEYDSAVEAYGKVSAVGGHVEVVTAAA
jgi:hypothetical protein